jgi:hypothetical protein
MSDRTDDDPSLNDRRYALPGREPPTIRCRVCFEDVVLHPEAIQQTIADTYLVCPHCGRTFLVRRSDWWPG